MQNTKRASEKGMIIKKKRRKSFTPKIDKKKEQYIKELIAFMGRAGFTLRRERLKRGPNWSAQSGVCNVHDEPVIFVDRTVSQDDQLDFLLATIRELDIAMDEEASELLSGPLKKMMGQSSLVGVV